MFAIAANKQTGDFPIAVLRTFRCFEPPTNLLPSLLARTGSLRSRLPNYSTVADAVIHYRLLKVISYADPIIFVEDARVSGAALDSTAGAIFGSPAPFYFTFY